MYDVSGAQPVNVTNQLLLGKLNALSNEMIVYKAPKEQHVITVFTDITCGYCHKLHEQMSDYNALGITVLSGLPAPWAAKPCRAGYESDLVCERSQQSAG